MILGDLGADIIKVEGTGGDVMRRVEGAFLGAQRGKRSLALDLKSPDAANVVERLVRWADIVHHNIRMPAARRIGLASDQVRSEEHTSELQSLMRSSYAVFCLKKKN